MSWIREILKGVANAPSVHQLRVGTGADYTEIQENGTPVYNGDATMWDDLRVSPNSAPNLGANSPIAEIVSNDGSVGTGNAMSFDGNNDYGTVPYYSAMNTTDLTIALWTKANTTSTNELLDRNGNGGFEFYMSNGSLIFSPTGGSSVSSNGNLIAGATQFLVATAKQEGANLRCKLYIDGNNVAEKVINTTLATLTDGYIVGEWHSGGWNYDGIMDNLQAYNIILTDAQITELYNNGAGTNLVPTGVTEATDLIMYFKDDLINQSTLGSGFDYVNNGGVLVDGLIGITTGSFGVTLEAYPAGIETSKFFTIQFPHGKKLRDVINNIEGIIFTHFHWYPENNDVGDVVFGLELSWNQAHIPITRTKIFKRVIANSTTGYTQDEIEANFPQDTVEQRDWANAMLDKPVQRMTDVPQEGIKPFMNTENISSTIIARLFRAGADAEDTYTGKVYIHEFDAHIEYNTQGSNNKYSK